MASYTWYICNESGMLFLHLRYVEHVITAPGDARFWRINAHNDAFFAKVSRKLIRNLFLPGKNPSSKPLVARYLEGAQHLPPTSPAATHFAQDSFVFCAPCRRTHRRLPPRSLCSSFTAGCSSTRKSPEKNRKTR